MTLFTYRWLNIMSFNSLLILKCGHQDVSHLCIIKNFWEFFLKKNQIAKFNGVKEKRIYQLCEDGVKKICPLGSPFVIRGQSLVMPTGDPWNEFSISPSLLIQ